MLATRPHPSALRVGAPALLGAVAALAIVARPSDAVTGQSCSQLTPVTGSTNVRPAKGVTIVRPPTSAPAGTQLVVGARYLASTPYKSVYAFISSSRNGPAVGEQFFSGSGAKMRCARIGRPLRAGTTRYIQYQLVPRKPGAERKKIFYKISVSGG
jgi:hypothetical protein